MKNKSPFVIRRGLTGNIADEYADTESKDEIKKYRKQYLNLYSDINHFKGEELYKRLDAGLNLDHYFAWLAFNYLVMNGDYEDEVFFYIRPETGKYDILPWDYDDLFRQAPHEGMEARNSVEGFRNKLLFSSEDALDRAIASDEYLYAKYKLAMHDVMRVLTPEFLSKTGDRVREELRVMSEDKMLSEVSRYVGKNPFQFSEAEKDIDFALKFVVGRRNALIRDLEK
jgi:spore coat protein CotH